MVHKWICLRYLSGQDGFRWLLHGSCILKISLFLSTFGFSSQASCPQIWMPKPIASLIHKCNFLLETTWFDVLWFWMPQNLREHKKDRSCTFLYHGLDEPYSVWWAYWICKWPFKNRPFVGWSLCSQTSLVDSGLFPMYISHLLKDSWSLSLQFDSP